MKEPGKLTALQVSQLDQPGMYGDGGGLWLQVSGSGKSWVFRYTFAGRQRYKGLGPVHTVTLKAARDAATACRLKLRDGIDPLEEERAARTQAAAEAAKGVTFEECAKEFMAPRLKTWKHPKHREQWQNSLRDYVYPTIGKLPVADITIEHMKRILLPIWETKNETANRVRGRIEKILGFAKASHYRSGDNPAVWRGNLDAVLQKRSEVRKGKRAVKHHPALPYEQMPKFMAELRQREGDGARALRFLIYTIARTSEVTGATPPEIQGDVWEIDGARMKRDDTHRVPLCASAAELVKGCEGPYLFEGDRPGEPLSNRAMAKVLERMGRTNITVHGMRSCFRDWAGDETDFSREVIEACMAHAVGDESERSYRRRTAERKRRLVLEAWETYCNSAPVEEGSNVVPIRRAG